jgi:lysyl-tRNA synthetase class I
MLDEDLKEIIEERIKSNIPKIITVSCGLTSSHLGDERNLREFLLASEMINHIKTLGYNTNFYLFNDSSDGLTFAQLRVGVNKDEKLIKEFESECGKPIKLIKDPFECHDNYSDHFASEILERFHKLGIFPNIIDVWSLYESGMLDNAKEIIFSRYDEVKSFLNEKFPGYHMKNIYSPLCIYCGRIDSTEVKKIIGRKMTYYCNECKKIKTSNFLQIKGKFSWKIDTAVKWDLFQPDFEPYSVAYLDPNVGSYYIAKAISEKFFNGAYPEPINIGSINFDRTLSYQLLPSLPDQVFKILFLENRKKDITISEKKIISASKKFMITNEMSFFDYVRLKLPYDVVEYESTRLDHLSSFGKMFSKRFLKQNLNPKLPDESQIKILLREDKEKIIKLVEWIILQKQKHTDQTHEDFLNGMNKALKRFRIKREIIFPIIRDLISMEHGIPLSRIFYFMPQSFLFQLLVTIVSGKEKKKID